MADLGRQLADLLYGESQQPQETTGQKIARRLTGAGETAATIGTGLLGSVPAGLAGLAQLIPTRGRVPDVNRAAQKVEDVQSALTYLPRTETGQRYLQNTAGALEMLGAPAEYLGEKALQYTGSPGVATAANVLLDPVNFIGMPGSGKATVAATKAAGRAAMAAPRVAAEMAGDLLAPKSRFESQRGAIKMKGGNWLAGEVETAVDPLKSWRGEEQSYMNFLRDIRNTDTSVDFDNWLREKNEADPTFSRRNALSVANEFLKERGQPTLQNVNPSEAAINNWIDKKLSRYIKNEMATPEDPVRKLADQGITHAQDLREFDVEYMSPSLKRHRKSAGFPKEGYASTDLGRAWEAMTDKGLMFSQAGDYQGSDAPGILSRNPWLEKVPGETPVYETAARFDTRDLGFDHLIDELKNSINPASDLPARLRWKPEDLEKVTMEQAVKRVHDINEYRAAKKAEANEVLARNPATVDFKTYETVPGGTEPNKMGLAWKEIKSPGAPAALPQGWELMPEKSGLVRAKDAEGNVVLGKDSADLIKNIYYRHPDTPGNPKQALADALKYEGDVMGHCVGGYCDDVLSGRTQIYSLRDKKGEPHVTIEVRPNQAKQGFVGDQRPSEADYYRLQEEWLEGNKAGTIDPNLTFAQWWRSTQGIPEPEVSYEIIQIKGKQNRAPKEEYLPFVQDFVRSGNWSRVGDIQNTGLRRKGDFIDEFTPEQLDSIGRSEYVTQAEINSLRGQKGKKSGGSVRISDNPDTMRLELAAGGAVKMVAGGLTAAKGAAKAGAKGAAKAAKEEKLSVPYDIPRAPAKTKEEIRPIAQRMAEQMTGEFVRPNPKISKNPAEKTYQQFLMERELEGHHKYRKTKDVPEPEVADIEKQKGMVKFGISGDTTMADTELLRAGPYQMEDPVPLHGGPRFPLGGEGAWASNNPIAANVQRRIGEMSQFFDAPVLGQYMTMGPAGSMFAQHLADANLQAIDLSKMTKRQIEQFNKLIREGNNQSGPRPTFPGIQDKNEAYLWMAFDPKLRIHFNELMQKPTVTGALNLPDGRIILDAVTEPELRNKEIMTSGLSQFQFDPSIRPEDLSLSMHPTYTHLIPMKQGAPVTRTRYPTPAELEFSDVANFIRQNYPAKEFTRTMQTSSPRQLIDQQAIDEIRMFEEFMKQYTGKKKGGAVKMQAGGAIKAAAKAASKAVKPSELTPEARAAAAEVRANAERIGKARAELEKEQEGKEYFQRPEGYGSTEKVQERAKKIKERETYPQAEALERARRNAVKMLGLPEDNTAMDRARAMGFLDDTYHGTNRPVDEIDFSRAGSQTGNPNAHLGFFSTPNTGEASRYAKDFGGPQGGNVMPLMVRRGEEYPISYKELNDLAMGLFTAPGNTPRERYLSASEIAKDKRKQLMTEGYDTAVSNKSKTFEEVISLNPANVRSRFAAFDPAELGKPGLLKKKGGAVKKVKFTDNLDAMRLAVQKRK